MNADEVRAPCPDCYDTGIVVTPIGKSRNPLAAREPCPRGCNMLRDVAATIVRRIAAEAHDAVAKAYGMAPLAHSLTDVDKANILATLNRVADGAIVFSGPVAQDGYSVVVTGTFAEPFPLTVKTEVAK